MNKIIMILSIAFLGFMSACSKTTPTPTPTNKNAANPSFTTGDGAIIAVMTRTSTTNFGITTDIDLGTAVAIFGDLSTGSYNDAGTVTLNAKALTKNSNNSYVFTPSATDIKGIDFSTDINWSVGTPTFTYNCKSGTGMGMPNVSTISGTYTSIDVNSDFTLAMNSAVGNADSVYFQITGASKSILKAMGGSTKSASFTSAELKTLGNTVGGSVVISPWNHELKTLGGKQIHVINQFALSRVVELK